jgi:hypothetical protein
MKAAAMRATAASAPMTPAIVKSKWTVCQHRLSTVAVIALPMQSATNGCYLPQSLLYCWQGLVMEQGVMEQGRWPSAHLQRGGETYNKPMTVLQASRRIKCCGVPVEAVFPAQLQSVKEFTIKRLALTRHG